MSTVHPLRGRASVSAAGDLPRVQDADASQGHDGAPGLGVRLLEAEAGVEHFPWNAVKVRVLGLDGDVLDTSRELPCRTFRVARMVSCQRDDSWLRFGYGAAPPTLAPVPLSVLGPLHLVGPDGPVQVPGRKTREVLTLLALAAARPLSVGVHVAPGTYGVDVLLLNPTFPIDVFLEEPHLAGALAGLAAGRRLIAVSRRGAALSEKFAASTSRHRVPA